MDQQNKEQFSTKRYIAMNPLVSFIIPVYNAERYLQETVESALNCGYEPIEVILVEDGSTDTSNIICQSLKIKSPQVKVLRHEKGINKGASASRKLGINNSNGAFIYFLDADDVLLPGVIKQYINIFTKNPEAVLIHGETQAVDLPEGMKNLEDGFVIGLSDRKYFLAEEPYYLKNNRICNSTVCVRKKILDGIDFDYRQSLPLGEDWVLWNLLAQKGCFYYYAKPVIHYRIHENSATCQAIQKGDRFVQYNLIENYLCLMAKTTDKQLKQKVKENLSDLINELYKSYQSKRLPKNCEQSVFNDLTINTELVLSLKKKIYNLERGYGYYFYFLYLLKKIFWKLFYRKG